MFTLPKAKLPDTRHGLEPHKRPETTEAAWKHTSFLPRADLKILGYGVL